MLAGTVGAHIERLYYEPCRRVSAGSSTTYSWYSSPSPPWRKTRWMDLSPLSRWSTSEWISLSAVGIALWTAWTSRHALKVSRQALKVSLRQEQRHQSPLELYLTEAYIRRIRTERHRIYVFRIVVTNRADLPNSLKAVDLQVRYQRDGAPGPVVTIAHSGGAAASVAESLPTLDVPSPLAARGVVEGIVAFKVPDEVFAGADVESYHLNVSDATGRVTELEAIILQERNDAEQVAQDRDSTSERR